MTAGRFDAAFSGVEHELRRTVALKQVLDVDVSDAVARLDQLLGRLDERQNREVFELSPAQIEEALRVDDVDRRLLRRLPTLWATLDADLLVRHVEPRAALVRRLRRSILTRYTEWRDLPFGRRQTLTGCVDRYEQSSGDRLNGWSFVDLVVARGPAVVVEFCRSRADPFGLLMSDAGLPWSWEYSAETRLGLLARALTAQPPEEVVARIGALSPEQAARYLPAHATSTTLHELFRQQVNYIEFLALWLRVAQGSPRVSNRIDQVLLDAFGDPLGPAGLRAVEVWRDIERSEDAGYRALLGRIARSDIEFFFQNLQQEDADERAEFWMGYVRTMRATRVFLARRDHASLLRKANSAADPTYQQALRRAGRVKASGAQVPSSFIMWFDQLVAVEFSRKGNATYLYERDSFERTVATTDRMEIGSEADLKNRRLGEKLVHMGSWQRGFQDRLAELGITRFETARRRARR